MCEYCENDKPIRDESGVILFWVMDGYLLHGNGESEINFCPMCGRNLKDD